MKKLFIMIIAAAALLMAGCEEKSGDTFTPNIYEVDDAPPYAVSNKVWKIDTLTWSDAIHIPECDNPSFEDSYTEPQCRSYMSGTNTWYYYNWPYVNQHAATLCPSPWRVPTHEDLKTLMKNTATLSASYDYGGYADSYSVYDVNTYAYYWSSTQSNNNTGTAHYLAYTSGLLYVAAENKAFGFQVRCVKD